MNGVAPATLDAVLQKASGEYDADGCRHCVVRCATKAPHDTHDAEEVENNDGYHSALVLEFRAIASLYPRHTWVSERLYFFANGTRGDLHPARFRASHSSNIRSLRSCVSFVICCLVIVECF